MKNLDSYNGNDASRHFSPELTCVPPLWNHLRTVGVAQAPLPVRFFGTCKPLLEPVSGLDCEARERPRSNELLRSNFC